LDGAQLVEFAELRGGESGLRKITVFRPKLTRKWVKFTKNDRKLMAGFALISGRFF